MTEYRFRAASATAIIDGKEIDLLEYITLAPMKDVPVVRPARIIGVTVTFTISRPFQFRRREVMLNLARYTRWPYTN